MTDYLVSRLSFFVRRLSSVVRHLLSIVRLFVPLRFEIIFYSKIFNIEPSPMPPCPLVTDYLVSRLSFFVRRLSSVARLLSSVFYRPSSVFCRL